MTIRETVWLIRSDYVRMAEHFQVELTLLRVLQLMILPQVAALTLYRISHYLFRRGLLPLAWPVYSFNIFLTGADINPRTCMGERCLLGHSVGMMLSGHIGRNATLYARIGIGGGRDQRDIGAGAGLPIIGDDVVVGVNSTIMGSIRIGDGVTVGAHSMVLQDVPAGATVVGVPARVVKRSQVPPLAIVAEVP